MVVLGEVLMSTGGSGVGFDEDEDEDDDEDEEDEEEDDELDGYLVDDDEEE